VGKIANQSGNKGSLLLGAGLGIAITVLLVFVFYIIQRNAHFAAFEDENQYLQGLLYDAHEAAYVSQEAAIARARLLGMVFPDEVDVTEVDEESLPHDEEVYDNDEPEYIAEEQPYQNQEQYGNQDQEYVWVTIPHGAMGDHIAVILQHYGIVDDAAAFADFAVRSGLSLRLMAGTFLLPVNGDFDVILGIIS